MNISQIFKSSQLDEIELRKFLVDIFAIAIGKKPNIFAKKRFDREMPRYFRLKCGEGSNQTQNESVMISLNFRVRFDFGMKEIN